jgi:alkanesulfonate monooxygenase SsuD/methylene tetrahydromethanopterin reductase-like flavin-dependent oxidoreductase (luciferase family)
VPVAMQTLQRPRPPLWVGTTSADTAAWAAKQGINIVCNGTVSSIRAVTDVFHSQRTKMSDRQGPEPFVGMAVHIVVGNSAKEARRVAAPAYEQWFANLTHLWQLRGVRFPLPLPSKFEDAAEAGFCLAGTASEVREALGAQARAAGINYLLCRVAFGNLPVEASLRSVAAIEKEIMPILGLPKKS